MRAAKRGLPPIPAFGIGWLYPVCLSPGLAPGLAVQFPQGGFAMKALAVVLPLALATSVFGQAAHRNFGSVVFPGGTAGTSPGITRSFGSAVLPGGAQMHSLYGGAAAQTHMGKSNFRRNPAIGR